MKTVLAYLRLTRPANIVTAIADILAGWWISISVENAFSEWIVIPNRFATLLFLVLATIGLYGGGVVMNDVADFELDKIERPERAIPSGIISRTSATIFGISLLIAGIFCAVIVSTLSGGIALTIAILALIYNFFGKYSRFFGPINMGMCRGGNLLLGMSVAFPIIWVWPLSLIPVIYIAAITMISRGEVIGGNKKAIVFAGVLYGIVVLAIQYFSIIQTKFLDLIFANAFIALFAVLIFRPLILAFRNPDPMNIRKAVKSGVISLIAMDAALATCFSGWVMGLIILALLPISLLLAKGFAVT